MGFIMMDFIIFVCILVNTGMAGWMYNLAQDQTEYGDIGGANISYGIMVLNVFAALFNFYVLVT